MEIEGSTAFVSGANRGLGRAFVLGLLAAGARRVYAGARDPASVETLDDRVIPVCLDVTDPIQITAATRSCSDVDLLVNNAGILLNRSMLAADAGDALVREWAVNVVGLRAMIAAFAPILHANHGGAIINMLSVASWFTAVANATYGATKHAALVVSDAARIELRSQGTLVVGVHAGFIDTDMAAFWTGPKVSPEHVVSRTLEGVRLGTERVLADERAEQVWHDSRADPDMLLTAQQKVWDAR